MAAVNWSTAALVPSNTGLVKTAIAQVAIAAGQAVYEDLSNGGKFNLTDADAAASSVVIGIAINTAKAGEPCTVAIAGNTITASTGTPLTAGSIYVLQAATAGAIVPHGDIGTDPTTGDYVSVVGVATSTTALKIQPVVSGVVI